MMGSMGGMGDMMNMMHSGKIWFINGVAAEGHVMDPMLTLRQGRSHVLAMTNATAWNHPVHLHGNSFRVISRNGAPTAHRSEEHTSELQSLMRIAHADFCLKKKINTTPKGKLKTIQ